MLQVYFGSDVVRVREAVFDLVETLQSKGFLVQYLDSESYTAGAFTDAASGASLFGEQSLFVVDTASSDKQMYEDLTGSLEILSGSPNTFVVVEEGLLAAEKKKFSKYAAVMEEYKADVVARFNTFALADALARKDKKALWLLLVEAKLAGIALEEIVSVLWWQLKTMRLAAVTKTAAEAGLKDFPYNKAKRALVKFSGDDLTQVSRSLLVLQHDSRLGKCELDVALERWVLTI